jgi:hypothetical protein
MMVGPRATAKSESDEATLRLAVLIDADNAQAAVIEWLLAEIARFGEATVKRIYGDFTSTASASWKKVLQRYAIKPVQQFAYSTGKNSTDSTLIIDAMDLLYTRKFDGFCLITSDSDFTGLAMRLREEGLSVFGFGEKKTPEAFCGPPRPRVSPGTRPLHRRLSRLITNRSFRKSLCWRLSNSRLTMRVGRTSAGLAVTSPSCSPTLIRDSTATGSFPIWSGQEPICSLQKNGRARGRVGRCCTCGPSNQQGNCG